MIRLSDAFIKQFAFSQLWCLLILLHRLGWRAGPWWFLHQKEPRYKLVKNIASVFQCLLLIHVAIVFVVILASLAFQIVGWGCEDIKCSTVLCRLHSRKCWFQELISLMAKLGCKKGLMKGALKFQNIFILALCWFLWMFPTIR